MADSFIRVEPDSTGKFVQTFQNTVGANLVEANAVSLVDQFGVPIGSAASPLLVRSPDTLVSGTLTVADTVAGSPADAGGFRAGASPAGSVVSIPVGGGDTVFSVAITGAGWSGSIYFEGSVNSTNGTDGNWIQLNAHRAGIINTSIVGFATDTGLYRGSVVGLTYFRVRAVAGFTPTATIGIRLSAGSAPILPVGGIPGPSLVKGTQGASGHSTQDLKDAGRAVSNYWMPLPIVTTGTDTLVSLTGYKGGAAVAGTQTPAVVTAGKTLRLKSILITYVAVATAGSGRVTLRANPSGVVAIGSPAVCQWVVGAVNPTTAGSSQSVSFPMPDGLEFPAGTGIGISINGVSAVGAAAIAGYLQVAMTGFEY